MTEQELQAIVERVVARCVAQPACCAPAAGGEILAEASARHVHLTKAAVEALFGPGMTLTKKKDLSQTGEFLSEQRVTIVTAKGCLTHVAVLGPERPAVQVELSRTDCRALGINAPVRLSGDLSGAADVYLVGPKGMLEAKGSAIVAKAHIHLPPQEAARRGLANGQKVCVQVQGSRPVTFDDVEIRVKDSFTPAMHIDLDEANACGLGPDSHAIILA